MLAVVEASAACNLHRRWNGYAALYGGDLADCGGKSSRGGAWWWRRNWGSGFKHYITILFKLNTKGPECPSFNFLSKNAHEVWSLRPIYFFLFFLRDGLHVTTGNSKKIKIGFKFQ